jgi:indolepyruvate ferredoxin oxidoreductase beta subunit
LSAGTAPGGTRTAAVNVLMAGVGGQGVLLASEVLALAALEAGLEAKQSEVHGVAQRGGSVVSHVRFGPRVHSPLIRSGTVDVLYAMERLEALRFAHMVRPGGAIVMNDHAIHPVVMPGAAVTAYPEDVAGFLAGRGFRMLAIPALTTAVELGDKRVANVVLLGVLSTLLPLEESAWTSALTGRFPERFRDLNRRAFEAGRRFESSPVPPTC